MIKKLKKYKVPTTLLVGEVNPYGADPYYALYPLPVGASGDRLCRLIFRMKRVRYLRAFDRVNLCTGRWNIRQARKAAERILEGPHEVVVLLGAKVRDAFGIKGEFFQTYKRDHPLPMSRLKKEGIGPRVVLLPHPSGRNLIWNLPVSFDRARGVLRKAGVIPVRTREIPL